MIDNFNFTASQDLPATGSGIPATGMYIPTLNDLRHRKHRKPKTKKARKRARKAERDRFFYAYGRVSLENEMLKRSMFLAIAVSRRQFDAGLAEDFLRLIPKKGETKCV